MLFHMMWSILLRVLALKTLWWKFLIGCWRTSTNEKEVSQPNTPNKMNHTMWKNMKKYAQKWCCKLCAFLFKVTCPFWKMWHCFALLLNQRNITPRWFQTDRKLTRADLNVFGRRQIFSLLVREILYFSSFLPISSLVCFRHLKGFLSWPNTCKGSQLSACITSGIARTPAGAAY